jgi:hypothetical protein
VEKDHLNNASDKINYPGNADRAKILSKTLEM